MRQIKNTNHQVCAVEVTEAQFEDHGTWQCRASATDEDGMAIDHIVDIEVVVAAPPREVALAVGEERRPLKEGDSVKLRSGSEPVTEFECRAYGARPAPKFIWHIGEDAVEGGLEDRPEVEGEDAQVLRYAPSPKDTGKNISCTVEHPGYGEGEEGRGVSAKLDLYFKPQHFKVVQTISDSGEGNQEVEITIKFEARPRPFGGHWTIAGVEKPVTDIAGVEAPLLVGMASADGNLNAGHIVRGNHDAEYEFEATLTIKKASEEMEARQNSLTLENDEGKAEYQFKVGLGTEGGALQAMITLNITVLVLIALIAIVFLCRFRGLMCFSPDTKSCSSW